MSSGLVSMLGGLLAVSQQVPKDYLSIMDGTNWTAAAGAFTTQTIWEFSGAQLVATFPYPSDLTAGDYVETRLKFKYDALPSVNDDTKIGYSAEPLIKWKTTGHGFIDGTDSCTILAATTYRLKYRTLVGTFTKIYLNDVLIYSDTTGTAPVNFSCSVANGAGNKEYINDAFITVRRA